MLETLRATEMLAKEGFQVMVYCSDDPLMAKRLEDMGAAAIMPLAAPIGSGMGIQATVNIRMIIEDAKVPVMVDAGIGTASDAAVAMELGCDAVLTNTAIAHAKRSGEDGGRDEAGGPGGPRSLAGGPDAEKGLCRSVQSAQWLDLALHLAGDGVLIHRAGMDFAVEHEGRRTVHAQFVRQRDGGL